MSKLGVQNNPLFCKIRINMGENATEGHSRISRRNFITGNWDVSFTERGDSRVVPVDVREYTNIESGKNSISLQIDKGGFQNYVNGKLIRPLAGDFPQQWSYVFDVKPRPEPGTPADQYFRNVKGVTVASDYATTLINVPIIWENLPAWDRTENRLLEEICRTIVHETLHVAQYGNLQSREQAKKDSRFRKEWFLGGKVLSHVLGAAGGASIQNIADKDKVSLVPLRGKITRRKFLKLSGAGLAGLLLGNLFSEEGAWSAVSFFDQNVDPSHKLCYLEENKWHELENLVKVSQIDKK